MRLRLLRAFRTLVAKDAPRYRMLIPVTDQDGDSACLELVRGMSAHEVLWATHDDDYMRAAYAVHAVTIGRACATADGYRPGWEQR